METYFNQFDANKDGRISMEEAREALRHSPLALRADEIDDLIRAHDANGDGYLQWQEFVKFWNFFKE
jgi:Ca2+-binding EF-hand superfamily protein